MLEPKKRIYKREFNKLLMFVPEISPQERRYLNQVFSKDLIDGLTEFELNRKIMQLKFDTTDQIDRVEAERIRKKLLNALGKKLFIIR